MTIDNQPSSYGHGAQASPRLLRAGRTLGAEKPRDAGLPFHADCRRIRNGVDEWRRSWAWRRLRQEMIFYWYFILILDLIFYWFYIVCFVWHFKIYFILEVLWARVLSAFFQMLERGLPLRVDPTRHLLVKNNLIISQLNVYSSH